MLVGRNSVAAFGVYPEFVVDVFEGLLDQNDDSLECKDLADFESTSMCARTAQREDSRPEAFELGYGYTCFGFAGHCQLDPP